MPGQATWTAVALGTDHSCGLRGDQLLCWGANDSGQLGAPGGDAITPLPVPGAWKTVALGQSHTCGIHADGSLWCWGANVRGELGDGTFTDRGTPGVLGTDSDWDKLAVGTVHGCAIKLDHSLWCWGANESGQIGDGTAWRAAWRSVH